MSLKSKVLSVQEKLVTNLTSKGVEGLKTATLDSDGNITDPGTTLLVLADKVLEFSSLVPASTSSASSDIDKSTYTDDGSASVVMPDGTIVNV